MASPTLLTLVLLAATLGWSCDSKETPRDDMGHDAGISCELPDIVEQMVAENAVDCSLAGETTDAAADSELGFMGLSSESDAAIGACLHRARVDGRDSYWLTDPLEGTDSYVRQAFVVLSDGRGYWLWYDSHPGGGGTGADTVTRAQCIAVSPEHLGCIASDAGTEPGSTELETEYICRFGVRVD